MRIIRQAMRTLRDFREKTRRLRFRLPQTHGYMEWREREKNLY